VSIDFAAANSSRRRDDLPFLRHRVRPRPQDAASSSLDLSPDVVTASSPALGKAARSVRPVCRVLAGERRLLGVAAPEVVLSRVQSGVGLFTIEAICSGEAGDLRLGCAYELADGRSSVVWHGGGRTSAPRNPVVRARRDRYERLTVDLRQNRALARLIVFGFSESGASLRGGGTLVGTTFAGARIELPLDRPDSSGVTVFLSVYNVDGEFVVRAEMAGVDGSVRDACQAYGFDRITWLDDRTPVG
jgi:uncharacterized protein involved in tellurium resistance